MANIVMLTRGAGGDVNPFLAIGAALKAHGHAVTLLTHCAYEETVIRAGLGFVALDTHEECEQLAAELPVTTSPGGYLYLFRQYILPRVLADYDLLARHCSSQETILVGRHIGDVVVRLAAEKLGLPLVSVFIAPIEVGTLPYGEQNFGPMNGDAVNDVRARLGLEAVGDWPFWLRFAQLYVANWPAWFASPAPGRSLGVIEAGFLAPHGAPTCDIPDSLRELLDGGASPVLITGGMSSVSGKKFFHVAAEACQQLGRPGILVTPHKDLVPDPLPDGVTWYNYLPFTAVMPRMGAVIHHGGIGTLGHILAAGTPQVILAHGYDRPSNGARLQQLGVAESLLPPLWQPERIAASLARLIGSPAVRQRCAELARMTLDGDALTVVREAVEGFVSWQGRPERAGASKAMAPGAQVQAEEGAAQGVGLSAEKRRLLALWQKAKQDRVGGVDG